MTAYEFETIAAKTPYRPKGIWYSEMFLFVQTCLQEGVSLVIESGVKFGMSTAILGSTVNHWRVISIDWSPPQCEIPPFVRFMQGDSRVMLPRVLRGESRATIGVLIDGPKNEEAEKLRRLCWDVRQVRVVAIHGTIAGQGESIHSHDPEWSIHRSLDRFVDAPLHEMYPNGPGLSVWVKP